jgi:hypothetical protein
VDKRRLVHELLRAMQPWMASEGFTYSDHEGLFKRFIGACEQAIVPELTRRATAWEIDLHFQVRFEAIEDLLNSFKSNLSASEASRTVTIRATLRELGAEAEAKMLVNTTSLETALGPLLADISTYGLLFFHRWSTVKQIRESYEGASVDWPEADPIRRCENLLTIYALKGDRQAFDHHATEMLRFMAGHRGGFYLEPFEHIVLNLAQDPVWLGK